MLRGACLVLCLAVMIEGCGAPAEPGLDLGAPRPCVEGDTWLVFLEVDEWNLLGSHPQIALRMLREAPAERTARAAVDGSTYEDWAPLTARRVRPNRIEVA